MAKKKRTNTDDLIKDLVAQNKDSLKELFGSTLEEFLEGEMSGTSRSKPVRTM